MRFGLGLGPQRAYSFERVKAGLVHGNGRIVLRVGHEIDVHRRHWCPVLDKGGRERV
jgi:hypothetical protein